MTAPTDKSARKTTRLSPGKLRLTAYWTATVILACECVVGGMMGALQLSPFRDTATHLGYPAYFMSILGVWYVAAGVVIVVPRAAWLKEWAYAGLVFNYTGAAVSHIWVGDGADKLIGPAVFLGLTAASWALRPAARRELLRTASRIARGRVIVYWIATLAVTAELAVGGVWDLLRIDYVLNVVEHLGYPAYLLTVMGLWKIAGAAVLLLRRLAPLTEWVYAGAAINYASAIASHVIVSDGIGSIVAPVALLALTVTSWALRPASSPRLRGCVRLAPRRRGTPWDRALPW
jgi:DoxX-like family